MSAVGVDVQQQLVIVVGELVCGVGRFLRPGRTDDLSAVRAQPSFQHRGDFGALLRDPDDEATTFGYDDHGGRREQFECPIAVELGVTQLPAPTQQHQLPGLQRIRPGHAWNPGPGGRRPNLRHDLGKGPAITPLPRHAPIMGCDKPTHVRNSAAATVPPTSGPPGTTRTDEHRRFRANLAPEAGGTGSHPGPAAGRDTEPAPGTSPALTVEQITTDSDRDRWFTASYGLAEDVIGGAAAAPKSRTPA